MSAAHPSPATRLRYTAAVACEVLLVGAGCALMPHLRWSGGEGAPGRSVLELVLMGGHVWQLFSVARTPLPFR